MAKDTSKNAEAMSAEELHEKVVRPLIQARYEKGKGKKEDA